MQLVSRRVIFAAAKLALLYCVLLCLELAAVVLLIGSKNTFKLGDLARALSGLLVPFAIAFLLLAVARRAGFVALWVILLIYWGALGVQSLPFMPHLLPVLFAVWSILALPLWIIGHLGIPDASSRGIRLGRIELSVPTIALLCWLLLFAGTRLFGPLGGTTYVFPQPRRPMDTVLWALWAPAPLWIAAIAVRHVWRGTQQLDKRS